MKKVCGISLALLLSVTFVTLVSAQQDAKKTSPPPQRVQQAVPRLRPRRAQRPLILSGSVSDGGCKGTIRSFLLPARGRCSFPRLAINTVEVISIFGGTVEHTITGVAGSSRCGIFSRGQQTLRGQREGQALHL